MSKSVRPFKNGQIIYCTSFGKHSTVYSDNRNEALEEFLKSKARTCNIWAHKCTNDDQTCIGFILLESKERYKGEFTRAQARQALDEGTFNADVPVFEDPEPGYPAAEPLKTVDLEIEAT